MTPWALSGSRWAPRFVWGLQQVVFLSDYMHKTHDHTVSLVGLEALLRVLSIVMCGTFLVTTCDLWHISIYPKMLCVGRLQIVQYIDMGHAKRAGTSTEAHLPCMT